MTKKGMRVDYLFGRIEEKCPNVEVLDISKKTGLSVEAVKRLMFCWISCKECDMIHLFHSFGDVPMANLMKKEIKTTFLRLLEERPYHQITVKEIVQECGINMRDQSEFLLLSLRRSSGTGGRGDR